MKFCRFRLQDRVVGYQPSTDSDFGRTVMRGPENIERRKEKECDGVEIRLKRHLVMEFRLIMGIGDNFRVIAIVV